MGSSLAGDIKWEFGKQGGWKYLKPFHMRHANKFHSARRTENSP